MQTLYGNLFRQLNYALNECKKDYSIYDNVDAALTVYDVKKAALDSVLLSNYLREIWMSETPPPTPLNAECDTDTVDMLDELIEGNPMPAGCMAKDWKIWQNLLEATKIDGAFDQELAKQVHAKVGAGIIVNAGQYRQHKVAALGASVLYAQPSSIEPRLAALFEFVNMKKNEYHLYPSMPKWMFMLRLGAMFYSEFLLIHPFSDGNGRTARILFSAFIKDDIPFPVSLYSHGGRDEYLAALMQRNNHTAPVAFATYVILACNRTAGIINWLAVE